MRGIGLEQFAPYLINRIAFLYNADMASALRARGLTTAHMRALAVLAVHPGITVNELADYAVMEQSTMSRTLDQLVGAGLATRRHRADDGRVREVLLTEKGERAFDEVWPTMRSLEDKMFEGIAAEDRRCVLKALGIVLNAMRLGPRSPSS
ncbi:MAG: MarR family transcriptional regulator [Pseudomonadota bacterium]